MDEDNMTVGEASGMLGQVPVNYNNYTSGTPPIYAHRNMGHTVIDLNLVPVSRLYDGFMDDVRTGSIVYPVFLTATVHQIASLLSRGFVIEHVDNWYPGDADNRELYRVVNRVDAYTHPDPDSLIVPTGSITREDRPSPYNGRMPVAISYRTETAIASDIEYLILGHLDTLLHEIHPNANSEQIAQAITPITEFITNISKIITERLTEMEIKINGRKRKIIRKDTPQSGRPSEGVSERLGTDARESERSPEPRAETPRFTGEYTASDLRTTFESL